MDKKLSIQDFSQLQCLDYTHNGQTKLSVVRSQENEISICKAISKSSLKDQKSIEHVKNQKQALNFFTQNSQKGINKIKGTFQDSENLYMLLQLVQGLPLHKLLQMTGKLNADFTRLIVCQIGLIMKKFHEEGYIYRDIKASNFMINSKGKVTMIDLGKAKLIEKGRTFTVCGTTHSMPPQVYEGKGYSFEFDHYSFGVLIYELLTGTAPFGYGNFSQQYLQTIKLGLKDHHLQTIDCAVTKNLIQNLMLPAQQRLGSEKGFQEILEHEYFNFAQFLDYKDILEEGDSIDQKNEFFAFYVSEIEDFGLDFIKYDEILPEDPFYKFFG